jgi:hypothetical protein
MNWQSFLDQNEASLDSPFERLFIQDVLALVPSLDFALVDCQTPFVDAQRCDDGSTSRYPKTKASD